MDEVDTKQIEDGFLPDFEGKPILACCEHCAYCSDQSDGPEYGPAWYMCEKPGKEHMSNLKSFPFETPQKCCELRSAFLIDWDKEAKKMMSNETEELVERVDELYRKQQFCTYTEFHEMVRITNELVDISHELSQRLQAKEQECEELEAELRESCQAHINLSAELQTKERECEKWKHKYQQAVSSDDYTGPALAK